MVLPTAGSLKLTNNYLTSSTPTFLQYLGSTPLVLTRSPHVSNVSPYNSPHNFLEFVSAAQRCSAKLQSLSSCVNSLRASMVQLTKGLKNSCCGARAQRFLIAFVCELVHFHGGCRPQKVHSPTTKVY